MLLDAADRQAMLDAVGETATVSGGTLTVGFSEPGQIIELHEANVLVNIPTALAANVDVAAHSLVGDPNPSSISILGKNYLIKNIIPDGDGFSVLELRDA